MGYCPDIVQKDLTLTDLKSMKWNFTLWHGPTLKCFPKVDLHEKQPEIKVIWKGIMRRSRRLLVGPQK